MINQICRMKNKHHFLFVLILLYILSGCILTGCTSNEINDQEASELKEYLSNAKEQIDEINNSDIVKNGFITVNNDNNKIMIDAKGFSELVGSIKGIAEGYIFLEADRIHKLLPNTDGVEYLEKMKKLGEEAGYKPYANNYLKIFEELKNELNEEGNTELVNIMNSIENNENLLFKEFQNEDGKIEIDKETLDKVQNIIDKVENVQIKSDERQKAIVKQVIDGDTIVCRIDGKDEKVRFLLMNTPENTTLKEPFGEEATEFTYKYIPSGMSIYLEKDDSTPNTDKYGRLLRYIWLSPDDTNLEKHCLNALLVKQGLARVISYNDDKEKYLKEFLEIEKRAKDQQLNIWN